MSVIVWTNDDSSDNVGTFHKRVHHELLEHLNEGKPFRCFVNPRQPEESILYRDGRWGTVALLTWAALMFSAVGFGLVGAVIASWMSERKNPSAERFGYESWQHRPDWAAGEIRHSDRKFANVALWVGLVVLVLSVPGSVASFTTLANTNDHWAYLGFIPTVLGLWIVRTALRNRARWRRYGDSVFKMASIPGVVGGSLAGVIQTDRRVESDDGFVLQLVCTEISSSSDGEGGSSTKTLWEDEQTIIRDLSLTDYEGTAVPVQFAIPFDAPQTRCDPNHDQQKWTLHIRALSHAADYRAEFEVPVFRTSKSDRNYRPDPSVIQAYQAPPDSQLPLNRSGLYSEPIDSGGTRFIFPRGRNIGFAVCMLFLQAIFMVAIVAGFYFKWHSIWPYVAAFLGFGLFQSMLDLFSLSERSRGDARGIVYSFWEISLGSTSRDSRERSQKDHFETGGERGESGRDGLIRGIDERQASDSG